MDELHVDVELLEEFERGLDPRYPERSRTPARVLGYGEISTVFEIRAEGMDGYAFERLPIFKDRSEIAPYLASYREYNRILADVALGDLLDLAVELRGGCLVETGLALEPEDTDGLEQAQGTNTVGVGRVLGLLKGNGDVALGGKVVDLVRLHELDDANEAGGVRHIPVVEDEAAVRLMGVLVEVVDAVGVEQRGSALDAVDLVAFT